MRENSGSSPLDGASDKDRFAHTGFGRTLEGEQVWPPKTVNVRKWASNMPVSVQEPHLNEISST
jgi:hypothetical protein